MFCALAVTILCVLVSSDRARAHKILRNVQFVLDGDTARHTEGLLHVRNINMASASSAVFLVGMFNMKISITGRKHRWFLYPPPPTHTRVAYNGMWWYREGLLIGTFHTAVNAIQRADRKSSSYLVQCYRTGIASSGPRTDLWRSVSYHVTCDAAYRIVCHMWCSVPYHVTCDAAYPLLHVMQCTYHVTCDAAYRLSHVMQCRVVSSFGATGTNTLFGNGTHKLSLRVFVPPSFIVGGGNTRITRAVKDQDSI